MTKVLIIGMDGATFDLIKPWAAEGKLPNLRGLLGQASHGPLASTVPPMTFPSWATFMTGKNPGKHGIFDFTERISGSFDLQLIADMYLCADTLDRADYIDVFSPKAEFNIVSDPLAARIVFESGIPVTLVPLDVTHQVFFTPEVVEERLRPMGNPFSRFIIEATGYDIKTRQFRGKELIYLHDPLAVGAVIEPGLLRKERVSLHVETDEGAEYGRTREVREGPEIEVCFEVASEKFLELFLSRLS